MSKATAAPRTRIAVIDADSVLYGVALGAEMKASVQDDDGEDLWFEIKDADQCYREVVAKLESLVDAVEAEDAIIALTTTRCFRYAILPTYKANRMATRRPAVLRDLQNMVQERRPFGVIAVRGLEADDVCGVASGALQNGGLREPVIVSIDKDLRSVPGLVFTPKHPDLGIQEITEEAANRAHLYQTLVGDTVDGYTGCPGVGPKKADKLLDECAHSSDAAQWAWVEGAFTARGKLPTYALTQARVARIVRWSEWDASRREVVLWSPPGATPDVMLLDDLAA